MLAAGTLNSDEARDLDLPLKNRFYLQPLSPTEAAARAKESAKEILNVKEFIDKKAWPYVQNDLRLKSEYLRFDLNTVISSKPKDQKKELKDLTGKLFQNLADVSFLFLSLMLLNVPILIYMYVLDLVNLTAQRNRTIILSVNADGIMVQLR